jgi:hypothetical protein
VTPAHLAAAARRLEAAPGRRRDAVEAEADAVLGPGRRQDAVEAEADAVLGPAADGGWWALGLRDPAHAAVLRDVPMSTAQTGARTHAALRARGLRIAPLAVLRDVDTVADARAVAARCGAGSRFAAAVTALVRSA